MRLITLLRSVLSAVLGREPERIEVVKLKAEGTVPGGWRFIENFTWPEWERCPSCRELVWRPAVLGPGRCPVCEVER